MTFIYIYIKDFEIFIIKKNIFETLKGKVPILAVKKRTRTTIIFVVVLLL